MLEVEMKFAVTDLPQVQQTLQDLGVLLGDPHSEVDEYFNAPDRDFAKTDEAVRLRRVREKNYFTYKGPKTDARTKTRAEVEVPLAAGDENAARATLFLAKLGYRPVATVRKNRRTAELSWHGFPVKVCLDQVEGVGSYVELEIVTEESHRDSARQAVMTLAGKLGLTASERRSYLELLLEKMVP